VGMVTEKWMMYTAVIVSVIIMLASSEFIGEFIHQNPSFKILGLCFLMMIGVVLLVEGMGFAIPSGYVYFSMGFALFVTVIQMKTQ
jgi:predicted tellurium resistance membrane protein TerC